MKQLVCLIRAGGLVLVMLTILTGCSFGRKDFKGVSTVPLFGQRTLTAPPVPVFPGAEGFGATSVGGRGGRVIEVTNLNDSGAGSLRAALEAKGRRIVVFRVAGTIKLQDEIQIEHPYLTVAGQTAPGGGITLKGYNSGLLRIQSSAAHDIVIRYLRLRNGSGKADGSGHDNLSINRGYNIILDHVSMSWSTDENLGIYSKRKGQLLYDLTIQRSIMAEGLANHSNGLLIGGKVDYSNSNNLIEDWRKIYNISIHHNLFANNSHRNPRVTSAGTQVINNVMYNWSRRIGSTSRGSIIDVIGNYAKAGPASNLKHLFLHEKYSPARLEEPFPDPSIYTASNVVSSILTDPAKDNWVLWKLNFSYTPLPKRYRRDTPLPEAPIPVSQQTAAEAYDSVLDDVGANARLDCLGNWVSNVDLVDRRILAEVRKNAGPAAPIKDPNQVGGYPQVAPGMPCRDSDRDGMPDEWEKLHHLNANNPTDGSADADGDGYTNVEEYLNGVTAW